MSGRKERVAKKRKKKNPVTGRCYCGKRLRKKDKRCQRCDRMTRRGMTASLRKAAAGGPAFLGKAHGGRAAPRVECSRGHPNLPDGRNCCSECGALMPGVPVPPLSAVSKSALAWNVYKSMAASPDPDVRELWRKARRGQLGEGGAA